MRKVVAIQFDSIRFNVTVVNVTVENGRELATGVALMVCLSVCRIYLRVFCMLCGRKVWENIGYVCGCLCG